MRQYNGATYLILLCLGGSLECVFGCVEGTLQLPRFLLETRSVLRQHVNLVLDTAVHKGSAAM